ncbi:MAG: TM2 domain-containing protein [Pseudomonadota bacterium]
MEPREQAPALDPDFVPAVVADLYRYRRRRRGVARMLAVFGFLGLHRFYLNRPFTGIAMLLSAGGGLVWWIVDFFRVGEMVEVYNADQAQREREQAAPLGLGFLPPRDQLQLDQPPVWAAQRRVGGWNITGLFLLAVLGFALGVVSGATELYEPVVVLGLFIVVTLAAARWPQLARVPVLAGLVRWVHRLRLFYHVVAPGRVWMLALRPVAGVFLAIWQPKVRAEVRLYLQFGAVFALLFALADLLEFAARSGFWIGFGLFVAEVAQNLVYIYLFVAPVGAVLNTQILLERRDRTVWLLALVNLSMIYVGWWLVS